MSSLLWRVRNYHKRRSKLIKKLGGECAKCGRKRNLTFDHLKPRTWSCRKLARWVRIKRYEEEAEKGLIQVLCADCNRRKGEPQTTEEESWS